MMGGDSEGAREPDGTTEIFGSPTVPNGSC